MATLPPPFDSEPRTFSAVVFLVSEFLAGGKVRLKASPAANISYKIDPVLLKNSLEKQGLELVTTRKILNEISALASVILRGRADSFIDDLLERAVPEGKDHLSEDEESQIREAQLEKIRLVEEQLLTDRVKQKFYAVRASKHDSLVDVQWEVIERKYDREEGDKARGPIAIMKFDVASRPEFNLINMLGLEESRRHSFIIECDEDDLDDLIEILTETRGRLAQERANNAS